MLIYKIKDPPSVEGSEGLLALVFRFSPLDDHKELAEGVTPLTDPGDPLQLLTVKYPKGHHIVPHHHPDIPRFTVGCSEVIQVTKGLVSCTIYNRRRQFVETIKLYTNDMIALLGCGHEFNFHEDSVIMEIRNGPYLFNEDKVRWVDEKQI